MVGMSIRLSGGFRDGAAKHAGGTGIKGAHGIARDVIYMLLLALGRWKTCRRVGTEQGARR